MTQTLQEALLKAGLVTKEKLSKPVRPVRPSRPAPVTKAKPGFLEGKHHHHLRTDCESCRKTFPDVEYYQHTNRSLEANWLCVRCADRNSILDDCRQTVQSQHAKTGRFRREYGATKVFK